jgi:hypothetical protein
MRLAFVLLAVGFSFAFGASAGYAQTTVFVQAKVADSRVLAGHVDIGIVKAPAVNITVEVRSSDGGTVLASTKTDANGYFHLDLPKIRGPLHLRLSAPGVNPYELRVRIKKNGPAELQIHLSNAA